MNIPDLLSPYSFLITMLILYVIITGRYLLASGIFYLVFYKLYRQKWAYRKLGKKEYTGKQFKREITWSSISAVCFSFAGTILLLLWQKGLTKIYIDIYEYALWWMPISLLISIPRMMCRRQPSRIIKTAG